MKDEPIPGDTTVVQLMGVHQEAKARIWKEAHGLGGAGGAQKGRGWRGWRFERFMQRMKLPECEAGQTP